MDRRVFLTWRDYEEWWAGYDRAGLKPGQSPTPQLIEEAAHASAFFSSTLPRAMETADAICGDRHVIRDPIFVEAPLPPPPWPGRLKPRQWGVVARVTWWMGFSGRTESRKQAERRAEAAAATLIARAMRGDNVVLCAHGWFNRMLRPVMLRWGWKCVYDGGDGFWSHRKYVRARG